MKKFILFFVALFMISCNNDNGYADNVKAVKKLVSAFEKADIQIWKDVISEDLVHSPPVYGTEENGGNYESALAQAEFYINNFDNLKFTNPVYLPGVDTVSLKNNGSVRVYGTWTGVSKSTGREFSNRSYHWFEVEDGKITNAGDFFDATGMINAVGPAQRNVVVFTAKVSKRNIKKFQELMDSDAGLTVTRNWDGCTHLEAFYNEETETYFIYEYWDSYKQYEEYLDWRFNAEEPSFVQTVIPLIKGGENGMQAYYNNSTYNFY